MKKLLRVLWMFLWLPGCIILTIHIWDGLKVEHLDEAIFAVTACVLITLGCIVHDFAAIFGFEPFGKIDAP